VNMSTDLESLARNARPRPWTYDASSGIVKAQVGTVADFGPSNPDAEFVLALVNGYEEGEGGTPVPDTVAVDVDRPLLTPLGRIKDGAESRPETPEDRMKVFAELLAWLRANLTASGSRPDWGAAFAKCPDHLAQAFNDTLNTGNGPL